MVTKMPISVMYCREHDALQCDVCKTHCRMVHGLLSVSRIATEKMPCDFIVLKEKGSKK